MIAPTTEPAAVAYPAQVTPADSARRPWEPLLLLSILTLALALRWWELERNGWGAEYYSAAVRSMSTSWHNFFFAAFDPAGFISVDKPPVALWLQVLSVKLVGFNPMGILLPQMLEGVASVWVVYRLVRRQFSAMPALLAALFLATTPVWVAVNRTNNTDSCLVLVLLLASWALIKAAETGSRRPLFLSMVLVGLAFNVKMLAAFVVLPGFFLVYWMGTRPRWPRRLLDLALASVVLAACALPWVLAYEATPAGARPYVGSSRQNSMLELVVGHNALGRFISKAPAASSVPLAVASEPPMAASSRAETGSRMRRELSRQFVQTPAGPLRLAGGLLGAQVEWLLPLAIMALIIGAAQVRWRKPLAPQQLTLFFWLCWIVAYTAVYSAMSGIIHFYYLATLAPALSALAGMGLAGLWNLYRHRHRLAILLPLSLLLSAAWQVHLQVSGLGWTYAVFMDPPEKWLSGLHIALIGGSLAAATILIVVCLTGWTNRAARMLGASALALGVAALLALPLAWSLSAILAPAYGMLPSADLQRLETATRNAETGARSRIGQFADTATLVDFLQANRGGEDFLLATSTAQLAANIITTTGEPVMARGGFHGLDPALSVDQLARMANEGRLRFVMLGDLPIVSRRMGAEAAGKAIAEWVRGNGRRVDPALWRSGRAGGSMELYDLHPQTDWLPAPPGVGATGRERSLPE